MDNWYRDYHPKINVHLLGEFYRKEPEIKIEGNL